MRPNHSLERQLSSTLNGRNGSEAEILGSSNRDFDSIYLSGIDRAQGLQASSIVTSAFGGKVHIHPAAARFALHVEHHTRAPMPCSSPVVF